jgi:hypothetical protein
MRPWYRSHAVAAGRFHARAVLAALPAQAQESAYDFKLFGGAAYPTLRTTPKPTAP